MGYDVVVVGGGASGCVAASVLAAEGKRVLMLERDAGLAGRARYFERDGYRLQWGPHLLEDPGSGLTAIAARYGLTIEHGAPNDGMAIFDGNGWRSAADVYGSGREDLRRVVADIAEIDLDTIDTLDQVTLREWLHRRTNHEGVIGLFEFMAVLEGQTGRPEDHSASDNLFMRALHLRERRKPGYSFCPVGGFDRLFEDIGALAERNGAEVRRNTIVGQVAIEGGRVRGVDVEVGTRTMPNEFMPLDRIEADAVVVTAPAWHLLALLPGGSIPEWYADLVRRLCEPQARGSWIGFYAGLPEPAFVYSERELAAWFATPRTGLPGFGYIHSALDPGTAPEGEHLFVCGVACDLPAVADRSHLDRLMRDFEADIDDMYPAVRHARWKVRHVIDNFGLKARPGLVGALRPHNVVPGVEGLVVAGDTYRGRSVGIDRAARTGLTAAELVLGRRVSGLEGTWRY